MIKIEKNVPIPSKQSGRPTKVERQTYPWNEMKKGDCFTVNVPMNSVATAAKTWANNNRPNWKFTARKEGNKGTRIWRIK